MKFVEVAEGASAQTKEDPRRLIQRVPLARKHEIDRVVFRKTDLREVLADRRGSSPMTRTVSDHPQSDQTS